MTPLRTLTRALTSPFTRLPRRAAALALMLLAWGLSVLIWWAMVGTYTGQRMEQLALVGSTIGAQHVSTGARHLLSVISMPAGILTVAALGVAGFVAGWRNPQIRWRTLWALVAGVGTSLSVQVLKRWVFPRPDFGLSWRYDGANTLPSGHTAIAAAAAVTAIILVPRAWRTVTAWIGALAAAAMGYSTLVCQWHRPADVVTAITVAIGWGALVVLLGAWDRPARWIGGWGRPTLPSLTEIADAGARLAMDPASAAVAGVAAEAARGAATAAAREILPGHRALTWLARVGWLSLVVAAVSEAITWVGARGWLGSLGSLHSAQGVAWWVSLSAYLAGSAATVAMAALGCAALVRLGEHR